MFTSHSKKLFEILDMGLLMYMYFAQMNTSVMHGVIMKFGLSGPKLFTKNEDAINRMGQREIRATTMAYHKISLKYLEFSSKFPGIVHFVRYCMNIYIEITSSVEVITISNHSLDDDILKQLFHIVFIKNHCHNKFIRICDSALDLTLPYPRQQCLFKKLNLIDCTAKHHSSELKELFKRNNHIEVFLCRSEDYSFLLPCFLELMSESAALQTLTLSCHASFKVLQTFLAQFFLSPYPVYLSLTLNIRSIIFGPLPEPLPINSEQQSKSLSLSLSGKVPPNLSSLLPQHIVLHSLAIYGETISSFAKLKSIKVHKICFDMDVLIDIDVLSSLVSILSAKEWDLTAYLERNEYDEHWPLLNSFY